MVRMQKFGGLSWCRFYMADVPVIVRVVSYRSQPCHPLILTSGPLCFSLPTPIILSPSLFSFTLSLIVSLFLLLYPSLSLLLSLSYVLGMRALSDLV